MLDSSNLIPLIKAAGMLGVFLIIFAESGLFFGFFLPGDSLLFISGFLASAGYFSIPILLVGCFVAAVLGDSFGYWFGRIVGKKLFRKKESFLWNPNNIEKTTLFYKKHGDKAIILARFIPIVRTFAPILAGVGVMEYRSFLFYNVLGGAIWSFLLLMLGYFLGSAIPNIDKVIMPIVAFIIIFSLVPVLTRFIVSKRKL